jgi:hypothetical protein
VLDVSGELASTSLVLDVSSELANTSLVLGVFARGSQRRTQEVCVRVRETQRVNVTNANA